MILAEAFPGIGVSRDGTTLPNWHPGSEGPIRTRGRFSVPVMSLGLRPLNRCGYV